MPCRDVIRQARVTRVRSKGLQALAKVKLKKSEEGSHKVFQQFGQSMSVKISKIDLPTKSGMPHILFRDWLKELVENDDLDLLVGTKDVGEMERRLSIFWSRYEQVHPEHKIYSRARAGVLQLSRCIPVLFHGDEGRSVKKKQLMVLSSHGCLGKGSRPSSHLDGLSGTSADPLKLNMLGSTMRTHFPLCVLPIQLYSQCEAAFHQMLEVQARDFKSLFLEGVAIRDKHYYVCCLGVKGDAPFLAKAGRFNRSFTRRPTRAQSKKPCTGICHQCSAGDESRIPAMPFEEYGVERPFWLQSEGEVAAYTTPSALLAIPYDDGDGSAMFKWDLFHNVHLGIGKYYASSAVCTILELVPQSLQQAFQTLTEDFRTYCSEHRESPYHKRLTSSLFGVEASFQDCPDAGWSKGDFTRLILCWFEDYCARNVVGNTQDPLYLKCVSCKHGLLRRRFCVSS